MARFGFVLIVLVFLAGCGSEEEPPDPEPPVPAGAERGTSVAALGDSITAGNPLYDPDPAQRDALGFGSDPESQYEYWAAESNLDLDFVNCGVFGERTDQIAMRLPDCVEDADLVIVQGGINDIAQTLGGDPQSVDDAVSAAAANIDGILAEAEEMGLDVAVTNVLPWNNGHPTADDPIEALNAHIAEIAKRRSVPLLDFHKALESTDQPGTMAPQYTDDGDHPSIEGYRILGELVAHELASPR